MNLLINEPPLQVLPTLALKVGLNKAIMLQQLHYRLLISKNIKDGHRWFYKTFEDWQEEEFPFWSVSTIKRTMKELEEEGYIISTSAHNKMKMDRTKWYRINTEKFQTDTFSQACIVSDCYNATTQNDTNESVRMERSHSVKMTRPITKEIKSNKKDIVEKDLDTAHLIIRYLNKKTGKQFKPTSKATQRLINGRLAEGYTLEQFQIVIDVKVKQWANDAQMHTYLRPSTLFNPTNFENYFNEAETQNKGKSKKPVRRQPVLDFGKGE